MKVRLLVRMISVCICNNICHFMLMA